MKNILLIGVGGTGSASVDIFYQKLKELGNQTKNNVTALVFDTDAGDLKKIKEAKTVVMADNASVGTICDRFGVEYLKEWFPVDDRAIRAQEMLRGASQWRKKSYLAFLNLMNKPLARATFISALEEMSADPSAACEVYVVASVAGGTGSGSFIPIALYAKKYLRRTLGKDPIVNAMIALPDIYAKSQTPENRIKIYANAYAILRELNAINLVARNHNAGLAEHKKAPIKFRIGDPNEPSVGLLFDASDKQFWTPEAAPFSQVFLLDRIPRLDSVSAHNIVLANALYTIICTDIGSAFDSEFSNHELLRSQNNGSNAIYAGISTSQIRFPKESILDYLAHKKTLDTCNNEWLVLHNAVETEIRERELQEKACKRRYRMSKTEYAEIVLKKLADLEANDNDTIISILERGVYEYDKEGERLANDSAKVFCQKIDTFIASKLPRETLDGVEEEITSTLSQIKPKKGKGNQKSLLSKAVPVEDSLLDYFLKCIELIKRMSASTADSIFTLDTKKADYIDAKHSIVDNLLKRDKRFIHPVAALIHLCRLRLYIEEKFTEIGKEEWEELRKREVSSLREDFLLLEDEAAPDSKSAYLKLGEERFKLLIGNDGRYMKAKKTDVIADIENFEKDAIYILNNIHQLSENQLKIKVYTTLANNLDILISKYRNFFNRFTKEKEELVELNKNAYRRDAGTVDSIINVFSSEKDKDYIYKSIIEESGPITDDEIAMADDVVGLGVFNNVYNAAAAAFDNKEWNERDSRAYSSLFGSMIDSYREFIKKNDKFKDVENYNVIEAMRASSETCGSKIEEDLQTRFSVAQELATPSLRLDPTESENDIVRPSNIVVFMMSKGTARYIKKRADEFDLHMPADQTKEDEVIKSCAEQFISKYSGNNSARVAIVSGISDQVLYCTGEIMDISPLRISKFNELGDDNIYYKNYSLAISNIKKYGTDMWNPHLGNDLHKRGYLPYMNGKKEADCDKNVVKALFYGFMNSRIVYKDGMGAASNRYFFECDGKKITDSEGRWINNKNIAQLVSWMRNEDDLVDEWSKLFNKEIDRQLNLLPSLASENINEVGKLESALTNSPFMKLLTESLYADASEKGKNAKRVKLDGKPVIVPRVGPTALEFAYMIKTSEESGRDCDDAERILEVVYSVFKAMCEYRVNPVTNPDCFIQVYRQQLGKIYESLASAKTIVSAEKECKAHFKQFCTWLNQSDVFNGIPVDTPMDETGKVCINAPFNEKDYAETRRILDFVAKGMDEEAAEDGEVTNA